LPLREGWNFDKTYSAPFKFNQSPAGRASEVARNDCRITVYVTDKDVKT
jgi:hypothetical protein